MTIWKTDFITSKKGPSWSEQLENATFIEVNFGDDDIVSLKRDGNKIIAITESGKVFVSTDYGDTWAETKDD